MTHLPTTGTFLAISTEARSRVFLLTATGSENRLALEQVTTIAGAPERVKALVAQLNAAVATADRTHVERLLAQLPEAVALACTKALDRCVSSQSGHVEPPEARLDVIQERSHLTTDDLAEYMRAAITLGFQVVITNARDDDLVFKTRLYSDEIELDYSSDPQWLRAPAGMRLIERLNPTERDLDDAFADARWEVFKSRAYWVWVRDQDGRGGAGAEIVMEHFDQPLDPSAHYLDFRHEDDAGVERGPLTPRNRFQLYAALYSITSDLAALLSGEPGHDSYVKRQLPDAVQGERREWWQRLHAASVRLFEAARTGNLDDLRARTIAEEALITLATRQEYVAWADEVAKDDLAMYWVFDRLPREEGDGQNQHIPPWLIWDADIGVFYTPALYGLNSFRELLRSMQARRDFSPDRWHDQQPIEESD